MSPLVRRLLQSLVALAGALVVVTFALALIPGDAVELQLGEQAAAVDVEALRHALGLDLAPPAQLWRFATRLLTGTLTSSVPPFTEPLWPRIARALPSTVGLAAAALLLGWGLAFPLGIAAALRPGSRLDRALQAGGLLLASTPRFVLGPVLLLALGVKAGLLPVAGSGSLAHLVLPASTLGLGIAASLSRWVRLRFVEQLALPHVRGAEARGVPLPVRLLKGALPGALVALIPVMALEVGGLLAGTVVVEKLFAWPGMGTLLLAAIERRDLDLVRLCVLLLTAIHLAVNLLADLLQGALDPRLRVRR